MDALRVRNRFGIGISLLLAVLAFGTRRLIAGSEGGGDDIAYAHAMAQVWERQFASKDVSYLLLSLRSGMVAAQRWEEPERPVPAGSLVKPFTAIAYAESHDFRFPRHLCAPGTCWLPRGHGEVGIVRAVAVSCNSYFTYLGNNVSPAQVTAVARRFGLKGPGLQASGEDLTGLHGAWIEAPAALAHAYAELLARRAQPGVQEVVTGMALSAQRGTASGLTAAGTRVRFLAKTGTAHCVHQPPAGGDGFVVAAWPADAPEYLLLLREHGVPGAQAAALAGRMLHAAMEPGR